MIIVSVVVPIYNTENYLVKCLTSIQKQSLKEIEIICVNDGSLDNSIKVLNEIKKNDLRIKVISQSNKGLSGARNTGLKSAVGEYVYFLDSDDFFQNDFVLEKMYLEMKYNEVEFVEGNFNFYYSDKNIRKNKGLDIKGIHLGRYLQKKTIANKSYGSVVWNKLFRRKFLVENKLRFIEGIIYEDIDFSYKCYSLAKKVKYIDLLTVNYRQRNDSIMSDLKIDRIKDYFIIIKSIKKFNFENNINNKLSNHILAALNIEILYKVNFLPKKERKEYFSEISISEFFKSFQILYITIGICCFLSKKIASHIIWKIKGN